MASQLRRLDRFLAIFALGLLCANTTLASVQFHVGQFDSAGDPPFSASWLHDASAATSGPAPPVGVPDNRAFRMGDPSSALVGSFYGNYDQTVKQVTNIRGTLSGSSTNFLLQDFNGDHNFQKFMLKLGQDAGAGKSGSLAFETAGIGKYTGGYIDYVLTVDTNPNPEVEDFEDVLEGTFFFKPQGENSNLNLSPNRGTVFEFTLWGYNYMHGSPAYDGANASWTDLFTQLDYSNNVTRPLIVGDALDQVLGISLYVTSSQGHMPEPTAFIVWGLLTMVSTSLSRRHR
jgi:hypothetical protein